TLAALRPATVLVAPGDAELPGARVVELGAPAAPAAAPGWEPLRRAEAIAHILFTSGSTASGKGVVWSELRAGYDWMISAPPRAARGRPSGIAAPLCASLGYHELVRSLYHGASVALLDAPFPAAIAEARRLGVDRIKVTPTHVELLLATAEDLPALRVISVTSAPIAPERLRALAARLPTARICRSYGLTESGVATMVWLRRRPRKLHTVGRAVGFRRVTVRDEAGRMLPPGRTGEVVIDLPVWDAADGYLDPPPELARRFDNGVLWTGDRGAIDEHGFLVLGSRSAEILKVGGRSVGAPRIEETLAALPGVAEVAVVGVPDRLLGEVPCAVFVPAAGGDARRLVDGSAELAIRPDELPRWFLARRDLPRGASGKLRRGQLADEAAQWTRSFGRAVVPEYRPYPAFDLERGLAVVDGCPPAWIGDAAGLDPVARVIALVARKPLRPLALAIVQAGATGAGAAVRFIAGPRAVALARGRVTDDLLDVFAGELIVLAGLLPGPRAELICAYADPPRQAYAAAGFAELAGRAGWAIRPEGSAVAPAAPAVDDAALREVAEAARRLAEWAERCAA
ncbi:MAG TPA: fatty acid--CoA ligase family protein, partial [Kofleriaceae bacterium]|nr:fatty acid--CoA ligase family protein [Kofleriaceae bacterium]